MLWSEEVELAMSTEMFRAPDTFMFCATLTKVAMKLVFRSATRSWTRLDTTLTALAAVAFET